MIGAMLAPAAMPAEAATPAVASLDIDGGGLVMCMFNPKDYTVSKTNNWKAEPKQGETAAKPSYTGGSPWELSLQLLLDTTLLKDGDTVATSAGALFDAMNATQGEGAGSGGKKTTKRPPTVTFEFGTFKFVGVVKTLSVQYTLFASNGEPIRADVKLALMQWNPEPIEGQNPTTRSEGGLGTHLVREGDSLASLAYRYYGDATRWRAIAEENGIDDPLLLRGGRALNIPRLA
jgi:nucleoid-associated protein YgaU